nr:MAG TPA: TFIIB zinc-binding [Caudoviricetes sp.]
MLTKLRVISFWCHCAEIPGNEPCWYCNPGISDTTERKNFNYCPICGRKLEKEGA